MSGFEKAILFLAFAILLALLAWIDRRVARLERRLDEKASAQPDAATISYQREDTLADFLHSRKQD